MTSQLEPVVILGAARSGTKVLRSVIEAAEELRAVPHDVNYLWRYPAPQHPDDAFPANCVTAQHAGYIRDRLASMAGVHRRDKATFVEKTVSNALRVPVVNRVLPTARYIHLVRDGASVTESALRCWQAGPEYLRIASKLRNYPWMTCSGYAISVARDWAKRLLTRQARLSSWGPRYPGIENDLANHSLAEVCAIQWKACVNDARDGLSQIQAHRWIEIDYESLVSKPADTAERLGEFLCVSDPRQLSARATAIVRPMKKRPLPSLSSFERQSVQRIVDSVDVYFTTAEQTAA